MTPVTFLLDGDATRRLIRRHLGKNPTANEIEAFCRRMLTAGELLSEIYYYDCAPFGETRTRPISKNKIDFSKEMVFKIASQFQKEIQENPVFKLRTGYLSFDGWVLTDIATRSLIEQPRVLTDLDFEPILSQKQVDMKIALDVAKFSLLGSIKRLGMITCDSDFIPVIDFAKSKGIEMFLVLDSRSLLKKTLRNVFSSLRYLR